MTARTDIVIFGGGIAGATLARALAKDFSVLLVDPRDFIEVPMAATRTIVAPEFGDAATIPFARALPGVKLVQGRLIEWTHDGGRVELNDGTISLLSGRVNVLATGSSFVNPLMRSSDGTPASRKALYVRYRARIAEAKSILIVGGGPIGVEVAGEISEAFPDKQLTIIDRGSRLLKGSSPDLAQAASQVLAARGVTVVTGEALVGEPSQDPFAPGGTISTNTGRQLVYDMLIWATGGRPVTDFMRKQFSSSLNAAGQIMIDPQLRVAGTSNLFAVGDINDVAENKMAVHILGQAKTAEANIRSTLKGEPALAAYKPKTDNPMMLLALGQNSGVSHLPGIGVVKAGWFNRMVKARKMLVPRFRQAFGLRD